MKGKVNYYSRAIHILQQLKKDYPNQTLGQHIGMALADYRDITSLTDKEFDFALTKYQSELEMNIASDIDVEKIYRDGINLGTSIFDEDEEDEDDF